MRTARHNVVASFIRETFIFTYVVLSALMFFSSSSSAHVSDIKQDETVQFFSTAAWFVSETQLWHIPIHAWVYEPQDSKTRKKIFSATLKTKYQLVANENTQGNFDERVNLLLADNERNKKLVVRIGEHEFDLPKTDSRGHVSSTVNLTESEMNELTETAAGIVHYEIKLEESDTRNFSGRSLLIRNEGISIISDIDDTVKVSRVTERKLLMQKTFFDDFEAVKGMPQLYQSLYQKNIPLHFVSSSPWHLYQPLQQFFIDNQFPPFTASLKTIRFKDSSILNLFKSGDKTKPKQIQPLLDSFPQRQFILIGDSGEQDPEVYLKIFLDNPERIKAIFIRNVTEETQSDPRFRRIVDAVGEERFLLFSDPEEVAEHLESLKIL